MVCKFRNNGVIILKPFTKQVWLRLSQKYTYFKIVFYPSTANDCYIVS